MNRRWWIGLMAGALVGSASGQERGQQISFRILSWKGEIVNLSYLEGSRLREFHAYDHILSQRHECRSNGVLSFYRDGAIVEKEQPLAEAKIPQGAGSVILLFLEANERGRREVKVIKDDEGSLGWGVARIYNTTGGEVAVDEGGKAKQLKPGALLDLEPELKKGRVFYLRLGRREGTEWVPFHTAYVPLTASQRVLCFLRSRDNGRMPIEFKRVYDLKRVVKKGTEEE